MSLELKINNDIKEAMLSKDREKLEALRGIKAALLLIKTGKDVSSGEIPEELEISTLQKLIKQRKEAADIYNSQNRKDLADVELAQVAIIEQYLPEQLGSEQVRELVQKIVAETGANGMKDMGKVMGLATKQLAGKAESKIVADMVKDILSNS
jgi:uncharacterized protein